MRKNLVGLFTVVSSALVSIAAWSRLPDRVAVHFAFDGTPNGWGSKAELLLAGPVLLLVLWGAFAALRHFDPKVRSQAQAVKAEPDAAEARLEEESAHGGRQAILLAAMVLLLVAHAAVVAQAAGLLSNPGRPLALAVAGFFIVGGNFMGRVRPNWVIGIRTPWTLSDDVVWQKTHRLAGRSMVAAGLVLVPLCLLLDARHLPYALPTLLALALLPPVVASYVLWRRRASA